MFVKKNTEIPVGFKITKCPPMPAAGKSIYRLEVEEEERLIAAAQVSVKDTHTCQTPSKEGMLCMECETTKTAKAG